MTTSRRSAIALDAETLLAHSTWLAGLARALVARGDEVDDVVQQTFVRALERPPAHARNLRGWLGAIARNVVRMDARSRSARVARETAVSAPPPVESPHEALERAELRRTVVESVLALDEPYRSAVVLRFFEEQDVATIARLTSTGEETVRTRLRRGVERVRERLERKVDEESRGTAHEGVAARALLFARLREIAGSGGGGASGGAAATRGRSPSHARLARRATSQFVAAGAVVLFVAGAWWWWRTETRRVTRSDPSTASHERVAAAPADLPSAPPVAADRVVDAAPTSAKRDESIGAAAPTTPKFGTIRGVVTSPKGTPVAGARVWALPCAKHLPEIGPTAFIQRIQPEFEKLAAGRSPTGWFKTTTTTGADGRYVFADLSTMVGWQVGAAEPSFGAVVSGVLSFSRDDRDGAFDAELVRGTRVRGSVVDERGAPIGGAVVRVTCHYLGEESESVVVAGRRGDELGKFDAGFHCGDPIVLQCSAPGFQTSPSKVAEFDTPAKEAVTKFELARVPGTVVRGRVVDPDGRPLDLLTLVEQRFSMASADELPRIVDLRAIPAQDPSAAPIDDSSQPNGVVEGRIDHVANVYELVVPDGFRGLLELRLGGELVGTATLSDLERPVDLPCDVVRIPKDEASTTFRVRLVDADSKLPIDLSADGATPEGGNGPKRRATPTSNSELQKGLVEYRCSTGSLGLYVSPTGYESSYRYFLVPEKPAQEPVVVEVPRTVAQLHGTVFHADGTPALRVRVSIYRKDHDQMVDVTHGNVAANPDGEFELLSVAKGEHFVVFSGSRNEAAAVVRVVVVPDSPPLQVHLLATEPTRFHVAAEPAPKPAWTCLDVLDADGVTVETIESLFDDKRPLQDDFAFPLAPGHYTAHVDRDGFESRDVPFVVPFGDAVTLELEPVKTGAKEVK